MKKAIFFDFDYTLGDSTTGIVLSANYAFEKLGVGEKPVDDIKRTIGLSLTDTYKVLVPGGTENDAELFSKYFIEKADEIMVLNTEIYTGVKEALLNLKKEGYLIGVISTKFSYRIENIFKKFNASDLLDIVIGSDTVKNKKPDPEGLLLAIKQMNLKISDVLYVGDSIVDSETAMNAGVDFAGVLTGTTSETDFKKNNYVFIGNSVLDVIGCIDCL